MTPQPAARGPAGERGPGRLGAHLLASPTSLVLTLIGAPHAKKKKRKRKKEKKRKTKGRAEQKERAARMRGPWRRRWDAPAASAGLAARAASAACSQRPREAGTAVAPLPLGGGPHFQQRSGQWGAGVVAARLQMEGPRQAQGLSCASSTRLTLRRGQKWS